MQDEHAQLLDVLVKAYDDVEAAVADLELLRRLHDGLGAADFDAIAISRTGNGRVRIDQTCVAGSRHDALKGLGFGLAAGLVAAIFPAVGIGTAVLAGGIGGAAIGAIVGHLHSGIDRADLREIADLLYSSQAALVVVYKTGPADLLARNLSAVNRIISRVADLTPDAIAQEIRQSAPERRALA